MLHLNGIQVERQGINILSIGELSLNEGEITVILGHNGSGKSTLMKLLARQFSPDQGIVSYQDQPLDEMSQKAFAQKVAYLPQHLPVADGLSVRELVRLGRFPWRGLLGRWLKHDDFIIDQALADTDLEAHAQSAVDQMSGGERQRAWIAMLLAQQTPYMLLDEPTSALDLSHQYALMNLLRRLNRATGRGIVIILHDINLAARFADRILALKQGVVIFDDEPAALMNNESLTALYDIPIQTLAHPHGHEVAVVA
ncbi:ABC transporter ATP-binding protein [Oceanospirillum maris]|uniref:ABC transporter ATP-binding protein n=1 Tax=Oceanospirillum maris TaxID=64977 RepID=UPI000415F8BF|nr:ABC transporter ATP-binding protein [Oceanospirillum maris]